MQAARFADRAWGVQPHPEAGAAIFRGLTTGGLSGRQPREDGIDVVAVAEEVERRAAEMAAGAWAGFGRRFGEIVTGTSDRPGDRDGVSGQRR